MSACVHHVRSLTDVCDRHDDVTLTQRLRVMEQQLHFQLVVRVWTTFGLCLAAAHTAPRPAPRRPLSYDVVEQSPAGTVVTDRLLVDSGLTARYRPDVLASLRFTVLPGGGGGGGQLDERHDYLSVEPRSARLRLAAVIDRDVICRQRVTCLLTFGIAVHPPQ